MTPRRVDVLIVTAIRLEFDGVLAVDDGALPGAWEPDTGPSGLPIAFRSFQHASGRPLRVCVAVAADMGAPAATNVALPLLEALKPRCIAMAGVCAGRPGKTQLGDVIAADRLYFHATGKQLDDCVLQDLKTYNLRDDWKLAIEGMKFAERFRGRDWFDARPIPYIWQELWALSKLAAGVVAPWEQPDATTTRPQWKKIINALWTSGDVLDGTTDVTSAGRARLKRALLEHCGELPDLTPAGAELPFGVHVAPMGSGNKVEEDADVWAYVSASMRKTLALEMEAAALGMIAHTQRQHRLDALVMKAVMDFANHGRDDHFKEFAARASAECLLAFLREHLDLPVRTGVDDLLAFGTVDLPMPPAPSDLLNAVHATVPWNDTMRADVLDTLDRWCDDDARPVDVRLLHADGGSGKTRLAIEWTRRRRELGEAAGFLRRGMAADWLDSLLNLLVPVRVVIDYAESRLDLVLLLERLAAYAQVEGPKRSVRLLLLARNDGDWWAELARESASVRALLATARTDALELPRVPPEARAAVFGAALERFEVEYGTAEDRAPPSLDDPRYERVLYLHMAALARARGVPFNAGDLMAVTLDHEERFWRQRGAEGAVLVDLDLARRIVTAATLRGGLRTRGEARAQLNRLLDRPRAPADDGLLKLLHYIYQRDDLGLYLPGLEPDLLGEAMVVRVAEEVTASEPSAAGEWIEQVFPKDEADALRAGFTVLGTIGGRVPTAERWVERMLATGSLGVRSLAALEAAKVTAKRTTIPLLAKALKDALSKRGRLADAETLDKAGIPQESATLQGIGEWIERTILLALRSEPSSSASEIARRANALGIRLCELRQWEEAINLLEEAKRIRRNISNENIPTSLADLAASCNNLVRAYCNSGRVRDGLATAEEAVNIYRPLHASSQCTVSAFAKSLINLGAARRYCGDLLGSRNVAREAATLLKADGQPSDRPLLAMACLNLGCALAELGQYSDALAITSNVTTYFAHLTAADQDRHIEMLAFSFNNLGRRHLSTADYEKALDAFRSVDGIVQMLALSDPDRYLPLRVTVLNNISVAQQGKNDLERALSSAIEALAIAWRFFVKSSTAYLADAQCSLLRVIDAHQVLNLPLPQNVLDQVEQLGIISCRTLFALGFFAFDPNSPVTHFKRGFPRPRLRRSSRERKTLTTIRPLV